MTTRTRELYQEFRDRGYGPILSGLGAVVSDGILTEADAIDYSMESCYTTQEMMYGRIGYRLDDYVDLEELTRNGDFDE